MTAAQLRGEIQRASQRVNGSEQTAVVRAQQQRRRGMPAARAPSTSASGIVRDAISASGGSGEPWCLDGVNAVRVGDLLFVIEVDDLGWLVTAYVIDGGEATPVAVLADENDNPVRALTGWLRNASGPMAWKRVKPGLYRSGGYLVGQLDTGEWFAEGPGVDQCFDHKHDAQAACAAARSYTTPPPARRVAATRRRDVYPAARALRTGTSALRHRQVVPPSRSFAKREQL